MIYLIIGIIRGGIEVKKIKVNFNIKRTISSIGSFLFKGLKKLFKELVTTLKYMGIGIFKVFDYIITNLINIFSYVIYAIIFVLEHIGKFTIWLGNIVYNHILKFVNLLIVRRLTIN